MSTHVKFRVGSKIIKMKCQEVFEDGSVRLIDGEILHPADIIEYISEKPNQHVKSKAHNTKDNRGPDH